MSKQRVIVLALIVLVATALTTGSAKATGKSTKVDEVALELVGQVTNSAPGVTPATSIQYGYIAHLRGLAVFKAEPQNESTALFTFYIAAAPTRVVNHGRLRVISRTGTMTIYSDPSANGSFANPDTFRNGTPILVAGVRQQVIVDTSTGAFSALMVSTRMSTTRFSVGNRKLRLGNKGTTFMMVLSGHASATPTPSGYFAGYTFSVSGPSGK
jgi:hypothetical protein